MTAIVSRAGSRILRVVRPSEQNIRSFSAEQARVSGDKLTRKNNCVIIWKRQAVVAVKLGGSGGKPPQKIFEN